MNAIKLLCCVLWLSGLACKHQTASLVQDKEFQCNKLVNEIMVEQRAFIAALKSVRDLETATEAAVKIREIANRFDVISEKFALLGPVSGELKLRLLKKMDVEEHREHPGLLQGARVFTPEEAKIINPAAELFFEKWATVTEKAGLYYTA